jgi:hypothetical protein
VTGCALVPSASGLRRLRESNFAARFDHISDPQIPLTRQIFDQDGKFLDQWTNFGTPWGLFIKDDLIYVVDGTENNCLLIANTRDGKVLERIEGLRNPTAVTVDSNNAIYVGEVNGTNVKKFVKK